jgi:hypothetical protein
VIAAVGGIFIGLISIFLITKFCIKKKIISPIQSEGEDNSKTHKDVAEGDGICLDNNDIEKNGDLFAKQLDNFEKHTCKNVEDLLKRSSTFSKGRITSAKIKSTHCNELEEQSN